MRVFLAGLRNVPRDHYDAGAVDGSGRLQLFRHLTLPLLIFEEAFHRFRFGPGSALMLLMFLITGALIAVLYAIFRARGCSGET